MAGDQSMRIAELLESRVAIIAESLGLPIARLTSLLPRLMMPLMGAFMSYQRKPWGRTRKVSCVHTGHSPAQYHCTSR